MNELISLDEQLKVIAVLAMIGLGSLFEDGELSEHASLVSVLFTQLDTLDNTSQLMDTLLQQSPSVLLETVINFNKGLQ